jgi:hypothetical protein
MTRWEVATNKHPWLFGGGLKQIMADLYNSLKLFPADSHVFPCGFRKIFFFQKLKSGGDDAGRIEDFMGDTGGQSSDSRVFFKLDQHVPGIPQLL